MVEPIFREIVALIRIAFLLDNESQHRTPIYVQGVDTLILSNRVSKISMIHLDNCHLKIFVLLYNNFIKIALKYILSRRLHHLFPSEHGKYYFGKYLEEPSGTITIWLSILKVSRNPIFKCACTKTSSIESMRTRSAS